MTTDEIEVWVKLIGARARTWPDYRGMDWMVDGGYCGLSATLFVDLTPTPRTAHGIMEGG